MPKSVLRVVVIIAAAVASFSALAQPYPTKPVRLVLPAAGGGTDVLTRLIARQLSEALGESVIVDNRPAVDGIVGTEIVARAAPDGHTLLIVSSSHAINVALGRKLPYDTIKDFAPAVQREHAGRYCNAHGRDFADVHRYRFGARSHQSGAAARAIGK